MVSDFVYDLCHGRDTVSSVLAADLTRSPGEVAKELFAGSKALPTSSTDREEKSALDRAFQCGDWGSSRPSDLFLEIFDNVLSTLDKNNPLAGTCSPRLVGTNGVCPLVVIATVPEICRHMSNLIVKARKEVFLATNFWKQSEGSRLLCNALRELSRRALGECRRVVVKIMYDRGDAMQVIKPHQYVPASTYSDLKGAIRIPHPDDIPNIDIEVVNYHRPPLGTFHAKFMIVDREIAILQSNNIQDNDNLEMMVQYEGPVVDSIYDMALITWHNPLEPMLPCINIPAAEKNSPTFTHSTHKTMFNGENKLHGPYKFNSATPPDVNKLGEISASAVTRTDLPLHTSQDPHYDDDFSKEVLRALAGFVPRDGEPLITGISKMLNVPAKDTEATAPDITPEEMMTPLIPIPAHECFPIAMVCREPFAPPTSSSLHTPQNAAFQSALRNARTSVFIQTPNLNAAGLLPEIIAACQRGVQVTYIYCLGYNDAGELLPMQGGHNESVANKLYSELKPESRAKLDIFCYVAKDQIRPIHNKFKRRSCHIKLMIVDGHIGIQGSGNQDTQSWYHSQEVNVMIDSSFVCQRWLEGIKQNQNSHLYGQVIKEGPNAGCWVDPLTNELADGAIGVSAGRFSWATGLQGAIARAKGTGGF